MRQEWWRQERRREICGPIGDTDTFMGWRE